MELEKVAREVEKNHRDAQDEPETLQQQVIAKLDDVIGNKNTLRILTKAKPGMFWEVVDRNRAHAPAKEDACSATITGACTIRATGASWTSGTPYCLP